MIEGGCHCGEVRYKADGEAITHALCHCTDCRRCSGAPFVAWTMYASTSVTVTKGKLKIYKSSENVQRHFCENCGTGIFYFNEKVLPGIVDIQSATYDNPDVIPAKAHIQTAERIKWVSTAHLLPEFERYPPQN